MTITVRVGFSYDPEAGVCYRELDFMGFPGYRVGDDGSVWTCLVRSGSSSNGQGSRCVPGGEWRPKRLKLNSSGYLNIALYAEWLSRRDIHGHRAGKTRPVHQLVLEAFVGPCPEGLECCHKDDNPQNNNLANLRWDTHESNMADRVGRGTGQPQNGENNHNAKLTANQVIAIRKEFASGGVTKVQLAARYGVSEANIRGIISRQKWPNLVEV